MSAGVKGDELRPADPIRQGRLDSLDGLRGLAVLAVMANHTGIPLARGGYLGVDLFFVLSGYLITTLLLAERDRAGTVSLRAFYMRRALRLYPALVVACLLVVALPAWTGFADRLQAIRGAVTAGTYLQDIAINFGWPADTGTGLWHTWTLSIEEQFYLVWPAFLLLILAAGRQRLRWVAVVLGAFLLYSLVALPVLFEPSTSPTSSVYFRPDVRAGAIVLGALVAVVLRRRAVVMPAALGWLALGLFVADCVAAPLANTAPAFLVAIPLAWFSSAALVIHLVQRPDSSLSRFVSWGPLVWTGLISYGLYLYHPLVHHAVPVLTDLPRRGVAPLGIVIAFGIAAVSYYAVERPFLRLKSRFERLPEHRTTVNSPQV